MLARSVPFSIQVNQKVAFGESIKAVGNAPAFGSWDADKGAALQWQEGDVWTTTINIPLGEPLRFKVTSCTDTTLRLLHASMGLWASNTGSRIIAT